MLATALAMAVGLICGALSGCKSGSAPKSAETHKAPGEVAAVCPARPSVKAPAFRVFHQDDSTITLVTKEDATDEEIESLIWELRDAAHGRTLDALKVSQKTVDERKPIVWFHIYRGSKCASEKYADGPPPCGGSYHAAGDFTYGGYKNKDADSGSIFHGEDHEVQLWDPDASYVAKGGS